ncbi:RND family efflux transporter MFP subunit [Archangium gephyra]|uniref:RND family efflux transporter MFP subunit n=1 Tax=Archangium gephyra TaxID=48 RepID=A0ABX9JPQ4_9BACT|nr:efflux RND transporter periplasmic adaptor subunit [Archangium gephyra]REG23975.1 RND family efflux transporter MFP subunit [Archangium gephyra]
MASRVFIGGLVLILLSLVGGVVWLRPRPHQERAGVTPPPGNAVGRTVREDTADKGLLGVVVSEASVNLAARLEGRVEDVRVQVGSGVRRGEIVATLESAGTRQELAIAEAALLSSRAEQQVAALSLKQAQERLQRREDPAQLSVGAISQEEVSAARFEQQLAEAKLAQAQARVQEQEARVAQLRQRVEELVVRAPFDGQVAGRFTHPGALVQPGQALVHVLRRGTPQVRFAIPSHQVQRVEAGQPVRVEVAEQQLVLEGRVSQVAPEVDVASLMIFALADVEVPSGVFVPAGTTVRVKPAVSEARQEGSAVRARQ